MIGRVLVVEDDPGIRMALVDNLEADGHAVVEACDLEAAHRAACGPGVDLMILDRMLPDGDGLDLLVRLRRRGSSLPVLVLTARGAERDRLDGLLGGADDYVVKPFSVAEVRARVQAILRRTRPDAGKTARFGPFVLDISSRALRRGDAAVPLTPREFDLLAYLVAHPRRAFSREALLDAVWGIGYEGTDRVVDRFVTTLRQKIETDPRVPRHVVTVPGVGYRFEP